MGRPALSALFDGLSRHSSRDDTLSEHRNRLYVFLNKKFGLYDCPSLGSVGVNADDRYNLVDEDMPVVVVLNDNSEIQQGGEHTRHDTSTGSDKFTQQRDA